MADPGWIGNAILALGASVPSTRHAAQAKEVLATISAHLVPHVAVDEALAGGRRFAAKDRTQRDTLEGLSAGRQIRQVRQAREFDERRHDVDMARQPTSATGVETRRHHDERDVRVVRRGRVAVDEVAPLLAQALAVIRREQVDGLARALTRLEGVDQGAEPVVRVPDLARVAAAVLGGAVDPGKRLVCGDARQSGVVLEHRKRRLAPGWGRPEAVPQFDGRGVGAVRILEVDPKKHRAAGLRRQPALRSLAGGPRCSLEVSAASALRRCEFSVEVLEAARQARGLLQDHVPDEGGGRVATAREELGERLASRQRRHAVPVADAVVAGIARRHDRRVRRGGRRRRRDRAFEHHTSRRETVDVGADVGGEAVGAQVIRAQRVDGDEQHVGRGVGCAAGGPRERERAAQQERVAGHGAHYSAARGCRDIVPRDGAAI